MVVLNYIDNDDSFIKSSPILHTRTYCTVYSVHCTVVQYSNYNI